MSRELFPHQHIARDFLSDAGTLLAGDPGTGKTLSTVKALEAIGARKVLVVVPPIVLTNWVNEFTLAESELTAVDIKRRPKLRATADVHVVSMDWMRSPAAHSLTEGTWDALVVDEAHGLATKDAKRTQAVYRDGIKAGKVMLLSGTPASRNAGQLWTHINRTEPERIDHMTYDAFIAKYCIVQMKKFSPRQRFATATVTGNKADMIPDLRGRLKGWWLRQRIQDVLKDLPPKLYANVFVEASKIDLRAIEDEIDPEIMDHIRFALETGDTAGLSAMSEMVSTLRRLLVKAKVPAAITYVTGLHALHEAPIAVWGWHTEALRAMKGGMEAKGMRVGLITGATPQNERDRIVAAVQAGQLDGFVGQIKAAGVGITLTAISHAVFLERSFNPAENRQAEDRHSRIGQKNVTQIDDLILEDSIDQAVLNICRNRNEEWADLSQDA